MRCYIFDIDGTLANGDHRLHHIKKEPKDWRSYFAEAAGDEPIQHMIELCRWLWAKQSVLFVSGRSDECREAVEASSQVRRQCDRGESCSRRDAVVGMAERSRADDFCRAHESQSALRKAGGSHD